MPCNLIISGTTFDVDEYLSRTNWEGCDIRVHYKGQKRGKIKDFGVFEDSGFSLSASDAPFDDFGKQQLDVIAFLTRHRDKLLLLKDYKIDWWHCLDFGLETHPPNRFSKAYILSAELMILASELGLDIWMSNYFTRSEGRKRGRAMRRGPIKR